MSDHFYYQDLGRFIIRFQNIEAFLTVFISLIVRADDEFIEILITELDFNKRVKAADVMFARYVDLLKSPKINEKKSFHKLMIRILEIAERRNELVHSQYHLWMDIKGEEGSIRVNSKLKSSKGIREINKESFLQGDLESDFKKIDDATRELEDFCHKVIEWRNASQMRP